MVWMRGAARRREAGLIGPPLRSDAGAHLLGKEVVGLVKAEGA